MPLVEIYEHGKLHVREECRLLNALDRHVNQVVLPDRGIVDMGFSETKSRFDTLLIGRKTFTAMQAMGDGAGEDASMPGVRSILFSRTMRQADHPELTIVEDAAPFVAGLKTQPGKVILLFSGGELLHSRSRPNSWTASMSD